MAASTKKNGRHSAEGQLEAREAKKAQAKSNLKRVAALSFDEPEAEKPVASEPEVAPKSKAEPKVESKVDPEPVAEPESEVAPESVAELEPEVTPQSVADAKPEQEATAESESAEDPEPESEPESEQEPESTDESEAVEESESEPEPEGVAAAEPEPESESAEPEEEAEAESSEEAKPSEDDGASEDASDEAQTEDKPEASEAEVKTETGGESGAEVEAEPDGESGAEVEAESEQGNSEPEAEAADEEAVSAEEKPEASEEASKKDELKNKAQKLVKKIKVPGRARGNRPSLFKRTFLALAIVSTLTSILVLALSVSVYKSTAIDELGTMLENECILVKSMIRGDSQDVMRLANLQMGDIRLTYLSAEGECLYDNQNNIENVANQSKRQEVIEAINEGAGSAERVDEDEDYTMIYRALRLDNGCVVRLAAQKDGTASAAARQTLLAVLICIVAILVSWLFARIISEKLMNPIFDVDPENPEENVTYLELEPLVNQITNQKDLLGEPEEIDLRKVVNNAAKRLRPIAKDANVKLTCSGTSATITGMPHMLDNLVFNLADNAIRYNSEDGKVRIWTGIEDDHAVLRVTDDGAGIPEDELARVFERFYQTELGQESNSTGRGLGLSVVKEIAEAHGAEIELESEQGSGTTVTVRFELAH